MIPANIEATRYASTKFSKPELASHMPMLSTIDADIITIIANDFILFVNIKNKLLAVKSDMNTLAMEAIRSTCILVCENSACDITYGADRLRTNADAIDVNNVTRISFLYIFLIYLLITSVCETLIFML